MTYEDVFVYCLPMDFSYSQINGVKEFINLLLDDLKLKLVIIYFAEEHLQCESWNVPESETQWIVKYIMNDAGITDKFDLVRVEDYLSGREN